MSRGRSNQGRPRYDEQGNTFLLSGQALIDSNAAAAALPDVQPEVISTGGQTFWMRPPQGQPMEDGTMPGEEGYVDPHAEAMEQWLDIDKQGSFGPGGKAPLHSDKKYGKGKGQLAAEGASPKSGNLRRSIQAKKTLLTGGV